MNLEKMSDSTYICRYTVHPYGDSFSLSNTKHMDYNKKWISTINMYIWISTIYIYSIYKLSTQNHPNVVFIRYLPA